MPRRQTTWGEGALAMNWMTLGDLAMANRDFNRRGPKDEPGVVAYLRPERNLGSQNALKFGYSRPSALEEVLDPTAFQQFMVEINAVCDPVSDAMRVVVSRASCCFTTFIPCAVCLVGLCIAPCISQCYVRPAGDKWQHEMRTATSKLITACVTATQRSGGRIVYELIFEKAFEEFRLFGKNSPCGPDIFVIKVSVSSSTPSHHSQQQQQQQQQQQYPPPPPPHQPYPPQQQQPYPPQQQQPYPSQQQQQPYPPQQQQPYPPQQQQQPYPSQEWSGPSAPYYAQQPTPSAPLMPPSAPLMPPSASSSSASTSATVFQDLPPSYDQVAPNHFSSSNDEKKKPL